MPQVEVYADQPAGTVTSGGTTTSLADTALTVTVTNAFPVASATPNPDTVFRIIDPAAPSEIMLVTTAPGGTGSGQSWTVARAQEGTSAVAHAANWTAVQAITGSSLNAYDQHQAQAVTSLVTANNTGSAITLVSWDPAPQDYPAAGVAYEIIAFGTLGTFTSTTATELELEFLLEWNGTTLCTIESNVNQPALGSSIASGGWWLEAAVVCISATSMVGGMNFLTHKTTTAYQLVSVTDDSSSAMAGITVSGAGPLALVAQWAHAQATNVLTGTGFAKRVA